MVLTLKEKDKIIDRIEHAIETYHDITGAVPVYSYQELIRAHRKLTKGTARYNTFGATT